MPTVLTDAGDFAVDAINGLCVTAADAERATGWVLKPEGMCRGEVCVPLPATMTAGGRVDLAAFWRHLGHPTMSDSDGGIWVLGTGAEQRNASLMDLDAPDITLPDLAGVPHSIAALRGRRIFLATWASWSGCRFDLPAWQQLFYRLKAENFMIVAVAEDSRGVEAARPWIEQAQPGYWCLIDPDHRLAALYNMVNVPQAVWIDEAGHIVRGPETAGWTDHFRQTDRSTGTLAPELQAARDDARARYLDAVHEWVRTGKHALDADVVRAALPRITPEIALAHGPFPTVVSPAAI